MFAWGCTIRVIPTDPNYIPMPEAQQKATRLVRELTPRAAEIDSQVFGGPAYIGCHYTTWGGVFCPLCGADIDAWWEGALARALDPVTRFARLEALTPCCGGAVSLNDLEFVEPVGFARFVIDIQDADRESLFVGEELAALEKALGCSVRQVLYYW